MSLLAGTLVVAALIAAGLFVAGRPLWWRGFTAAGIAAAASLLISCTIVLPLFGRETGALAYGFLAAGAVRAATFGTVVVIAIKTGGYPHDATLALAGIFYAAIVCIEGLVLYTLTHPTTQDRA